MSIDNKNAINVDDLAKVVGGTENTTFESKRTEFEAAWKNLEMDQKGFSGMKKAELFDEWEFAKYTPEATVFLAGKKS